MKKSDCSRGGPIYVYDAHQQGYTANHGVLHPSSDSAAIDPDSGVKRGLSTRHLSMMALAGIIGPGLLVGAGGALANGGPASLLIGFGVIVARRDDNLVSFWWCLSGLADRFVDKAFGVAVGWNYFIIWVAVLANEYNVICSVLTYWTDRVPLWGWFLIFWFVFLGFQMLGVTAFGEAEFWLAILKLAGLTAFFIFAIMYAAGGLIGQDEPLGFRYWHDPGPWSMTLPGFRGVATVFVFCSTFYAGVESIAVAATETKNPARAVPLATRQVLWRIIFIYMGSAYFFGLTCPSDAEGLASGGSRALRSPMTIAIQNAGWQGGVNLVNAFIFITVLSAINASIYIGSRTIVFMAQNGKAPRFLGKTDTRGVPVYAIIFTNLFGALSMMNISTGAGRAYSYIVNLSCVSTFLVWGAISFTHIRFRSAWAYQRRSVDELPFKSLWYPWSAYSGLFANVFLAFVQGWTTLSPFNAGNFVDAYVLLPLFPIIYFGYKWWNGTKYWQLEEIDLNHGRRRDLDAAKKSVDDDLAYGRWKKKQTIWRKLARNF
ncbi:General amino acid permease [Lithohypha guttulata]|uniref:General amino acid permease n=1 Tax=Lithohypha guttulata TaxID=1690604 RepID=A0AAN7STK2_9EURO|nr:General amino acid permease [Lithohypha guttulata]